MKRLLLTVGILGAVLALGACQNMPAPQTKSEVVAVRQSVAVDRSMVYSYRLGTDAHARPYLLIVLNDRGVALLNEVAQRGQPYDITLAGRAYTQTAQVNTGFLVLSPVDSAWTEQSLAQWFQ